MNLIILHGNGVVALSQKITQIKKEFDSLAIFEFNGKKSNLEGILAEISTGGLFSEKRLVILEEFEGIDLEKLPLDEELTLVLKYGKNLASNSLVLKKAIALKAKIISLTEKDEVLIFPFLDALAEKNKKQVFDRLDKLLSDYGGQYMLTMIFFMLRRFLFIPKNLPSFVIKKIEFQQKQFSKEKIKTLYREAIETDFRIKKGLVEEKMGIFLLVEKILTI